MRTMKRAVIAAGAVALATVLPILPAIAEAARAHPKRI